MDDQKNGRNHFIDGFEIANSVLRIFVCLITKKLSNHCLSEILVSEKKLLLQKRKHSDTPFWNQKDSLSQFGIAESILKAFKNL